MCSGQGRRGRLGFGGFSPRPTAGSDHRCGSCSPRRGAEADTTAARPCMESLIYGSAAIPSRRRLRPVSPEMLCANWAGLPALLRPAPPRDIRTRVCDVRRTSSPSPSFAPRARSDSTAPVARIITAFLRGVLPLSSRAARMPGELSTTASAAGRSDERRDTRWATSAEDARAAGSESVGAVETAGATCAATAAPSGCAEGAVEGADMQAGRPGDSVRMRGGKGEVFPGAARPTRAARRRHALPQQISGA